MNFLSYHEKVNIEEALSNACMMPKCKIDEVLMELDSAKDQAESHVSNIIDYAQSILKNYMGIGDLSKRNLHSVINRLAYQKS